MPTIESERPPINQNAIHVTSGELDDLIKSGNVAPYQRYTVSVESAVTPVATEAVPQSDEDYYDYLENMRVGDLPTPESNETQEPLQRVGINYVPGEPPLEAIITGSRPDPNRPGKILFSVIPANPDDAADFPKVAPEEALVPSQIETKVSAETPLQSSDVQASDEIDSNARMVSAEERKQQRELLNEAREAVEAAYASTPTENGDKAIETTTENKSAVDKASEILDTLEAGLSDKDRIALKQYANGSYANKSYEMTAAEKKMSGAIINNKELKIAYAKAWASLMDARKTQEN